MGARGGAQALSETWRASRLKRKQKRQKGVGSSGEERMWGRRGGAVGGGGWGEGGGGEGTGGGDKKSRRWVTMANWTSEIWRRSGGMAREAENSGSSSRRRGLRTRLSRRVTGGATKHIWSKRSAAGGAGSSEGTKGERGRRW